MGINDGGPAFPTTPISHGYPEGTFPNGTGCGPGMTLRDWFAGQSLSGLNLSDPDLSYEDGAKIAYKFADEMLKARG